MATIWRRVRAAAAMGVIWALVWGVGGGVLMEGIFDRDGRWVDMWPQVLAIPGFLCGVVFALLLSAAERRRRFDELSFRRFLALGVATGLTVGGAVLAAGFGRGGAPFLVRALVLLGAPTALSAVSAVGVLAVARRAARREALGAGNRP